MTFKAVEAGACVWPLNQHYCWRVTSWWVIWEGNDKQKTPGMGGVIMTLKMLFIFIEHEKQRNTWQSKTTYAANLWWSCHIPCGNCFVTLLTRNPNLPLWGSLSSPSVGVTHFGTKSCKFTVQPLIIPHVVFLPSLLPSAGQMLSQASAQRWQRHGVQAAVPHMHYPRIPALVWQRGTGWSLYWWVYLGSKKELEDLKLTELEQVSRQYAGKINHTFLMYLLWDDITEF